MSGLTACTPASKATKVEVNQRGGEKRLNVIFSRAKHHMAVVSSLRHPDITNDYNDGANALKDFLRYAESVSRTGDAEFIFGNGMDWIKKNAKNKFFKFSL